MKDCKTGRYLFIGRFQPFHLGHLEVIKQLLPKTQELVLGLGSTNQRISLINPLTYQERKIIIQYLLSRNLPSQFLRKIKLSPIPDTKTDLQWKVFIERKYPKHLVVTGNSWLRNIFGEKTFRLPVRFKNISATQVRNLFLRGEFAQAFKYLPAGYEKFLLFLKIRFNRLKNLQ